MYISATELPNFITKYYLSHEILIFKYWRQNISVFNIALHTAVTHSGRTTFAPVYRTHETEHLLTHKTPDFITPALMWPANSPDLNPVDYQILSKLQDRVYRSQIRDVDQLKSCRSRLIEEWEHFHHVVIDEAVRQWRPRLWACVRAHGGHFEHRL